MNYKHKISIVSEAEINIRIRKKYIYIRRLLPLLAALQGLHLCCDISHFIFELLQKKNKRQYNWKLLGITNTITKNGITNTITKQLE